MSKETFNHRAATVKTAVTEAEGKFAAVPDEKKVLVHSNILTDMRAAVRELDALRKGSKDQKAVDVDFSEYVKEKWGFAPSNDGQMDSFFDAIGINASEYSIEKLYTMPEFDEGYRWLVPELFRSAIRTGLRKPSIYPNLIAMEETISQPQINMPSVNVSEAMPKKLNEAESIPLGNLSFAQKTVAFKKVGIGLQLTDEVVRFSSLNLLSIFLADAGIKMNNALDTDAINTLIYGDQQDGSDSIAVIGTADGATFKYRDILRAWIRMGRIGRLPGAMIAGEEAALDILELNEFKGFAGDSKVNTNIVVRTPIPSSQNLWVHGSMTDTDQLMLVDPTAALVKINVEALQVESERIANKQLSNSYVSMRTGFATLFRDARLILDKSVTAASSPYPAWYDVAGQETQTWK